MPGRILLGSHWRAGYEVKEIMKSLITKVMLSLLGLGLMVGVAACDTGAAKTQVSVNSASTTSHVILNVKNPKDLTGKSARLQVRVYEHVVNPGPAQVVNVRTVLKDGASRTVDLINKVQFEQNETYRVVVWDCTANKASDPIGVFNGAEIELMPIIGGNPGMPEIVC